MVSKGLMYTTVVVESGQLWKACHLVLHFRFLLSTYTVNYLETGTVQLFFHMSVSCDTMSFVGKICHHC